MFAHDTLRTPWHAFAHDTHQGLWGTTHHWTEAGAYHLSPPMVGQEGGAACPQATGRGAGATSHLVLSSVVSWFSYPGRPRGGLTVVPSRHLLLQDAEPVPQSGKRTLQEPYAAPAPSEYPLPLGHSLEKRTFVRPLSRVPLLAPFPSRPSTLSYESRVPPANIG